MKNSAIPARHIDKRLRNYWVAQGLIEIKGIWPFQKAHLTAKGQREGLPQPIRGLADLMLPPGEESK